MVETAPTTTVLEQCVVYSADVVGTAFARQYYTILQQSPGLVYRFYQDSSKVGRAESNADVMRYTTTMAAINQKILSSGSLKADIKFVDAQESHNGGVVVLVNGSMVKEDNSRRKFTQTFFLAPQDKGYYVLNDIFRYVEDGDSDSREQQDDGIAPATPTEEAPPMPENDISELSNGEVHEPNGEVHEPNGEVHESNGEMHEPNVEAYNPTVEVCNPMGELPIKEVKEVAQVEEEEPVAEVADEVPQDSWVLVESSAKLEDTPKRSYASIVMKDASATTPSPTHSKAVSKMQDREVLVDPPIISVAVPPSASEEIIDNDENQAPEGKGHSIYCRNLPVNVPHSLVVEVFQEFGPIKSGGIQIRHNMGFPFGFVEFETAAAAHSAIKASYVLIDGHKVTVEEKKSTGIRGSSYVGNNRGRYPPGRGGNSYRGEGGRGGRGGYGGGRGYGRGDNNKSDFGGRGGGRGFQNRSEGYPRSDQTGTRSGHMNRGGVLSHPSTQPQRVSGQA